MKAKKQEALALHVVAEPKKGLDDYLGLPYTFRVFQLENADGPYWAASVNEIRGVNGHGDTPEAALACARDSLRYWLEAAVEDPAISIPEPGQEDVYSGKFNVRVPRSVHQRLVERAVREGVSLNAWISSVLARHGA